MRQMAKSKLMAIIIAAVVVVAGAAVAVPMIKNQRVNTQIADEPTTQISTEAFSVPVETLPGEEMTVTETVAETVTNDEGYPVFADNGSVLTTIRKVVNTTKNTAGTTAKKSSGKTTPKKNNGSADSGKQTYSQYTDTGVWYVDAVGRALNSMEQKAVLGYSYNSAGDYFYTDDKDCWQSGFGYNEVYDQCAPLGCMWIDDVRIRFDYDDKAWMIQLWKGQYGWVFVGAEIGVYTTNQFKTADVDPNAVNHYNCASQSDWLNMKMDVLWDDDRDGEYTRIFTRDYTKYWWCTGFKFGTLNRFASPINELIMKARVTFKSEKMATLFTKGMKNCGFKSASSSDSLSNDSIFQSGADVYFKWKSVYDQVYSENISSKQASKESSKQAEKTTETPVPTENTTVFSGKPD